MKICLVGVFPEKPGEVKGGVANVILYLAKGLYNEGHEVHIVSASSKKEQTITSWNDFTVHFVKIPRYLPRVFTNPTILRKKIQKKIDNINPDICHFHGTSTYMLNYKKPCVLTLHGVPELDALYTIGKFNKLKSYLQSKVEGYCRKRAQNIIIISKYLTDFLSDDINGRTWIIENPVFTSFFKIKRKPKPIIFYAGMISRRKNIMGLLQAFKKVHDHNPECLLHIAGPVRDKKYFDTCSDFIDKNKLNEKVVFLGSLEPLQVTEELSKVACTVLLSYQETAPLIISESMAAGIPVVASDAGGTRYMIEDGITGFLVSSNDTDTIAKKISLILDDLNLSESMQKAAQDTARTRFHIDSILEKTLDAYKTILN